MRGHRIVFRGIQQPFDFQKRNHSKDVVFRSELLKKVILNTD